jgi:hypothetical protein
MCAAGCSSGIARSLLLLLLLARAIMPAAPLAAC